MGTASHGDDAARELLDTRRRAVAAKERVLEAQRDPEFFFDADLPETPAPPRHLSHDQDDGRDGDEKDEDVTPLAPGGFQISTEDGYITR